MRTVEDGTVRTIEAAGYRLQVRVPELVAVLADPDGRIWSRLSLLASVDRVDDLTPRLVHAGQLTLDVRRRGAVVLLNYMIR